MMLVKAGVSLRHAVREDIKSVPRGMELAAVIIGVSHPQTVRNYTCETKRETHAMSLDQFESLLEWTGGHNTAQAVADMAGGIFIKTDDGDIAMPEGDLIQDMAGTLASLSALVGSIQEAVSDGVVANHEWQTIQGKRVDLVKSVQRLVSQVSALRV